MKVEGTQVLRAPREQVWKLLDDPQALASCTPGLQELRPLGPDEFEATLSIGIAAVRGTYKGKLRITERTPPDRYVVQVEGSGAPGFVRATGQLELVDRGPETEVRWSGDVQVGGALTIGSRMIPGIARMLAAQFFECLDRKLASG
ncbi:MAG: carbon monoxide dehydrogenase subunit G [Armatimonadota bacterium]|nr:carbon monoxide dehydrogenase subunit G [Armatimonadota bacterium]MDR7438522.1 carbon monoxide dehydrogenase subunit G [Armatimonadota bacterium]MDR7562330.1 carbon monoxide dehydrogenase subunit G [Armatimonadota bacterium]MDR7568850.1 carbon monoxide dehydrogenase subunit G [Armatimonadota bacterium]MDR7602435.1 carbon monoxide dehydrogenase subunit G [Armatimonadota bacterium]